MLRGLYTAGLGMTTQMNRMDLVSNNIANVNTTGFKKDISAVSSFDEALAKRTHDIEDRIFAPVTRVRDIGNITYGVFVEEVFTDFSQGNIQTTQGTYDLAISGGGFFAVNTGAGERYTRDGSFTVNAEGYIVTKDGGRVLGQGGEIQIPNGTVVIDEKGGISVNGEFIDTIRIVDFEDYKTLRKQGDNYLATTDETTESDFEGSIVQGALELSNVNSVKEMVDLITVNRIYEANAKVVTTIDQVMQKASQEVGRK